MVALAPDNFINFYRLLFFLSLALSLSLSIL